MSDEEKINTCKLEIEALGHAIQSGVAMEHSRGSRDGEPKFLRTGVNIALVEVGAVGRLLVQKGICTELEYWEAMVQGYKDEVARYEERLSESLGGANIRLG